MMTARLKKPAKVLSVDDDTRWAYMIEYALITERCQYRVMAFVRFAGINFLMQDNWGILAKKIGNRLCGLAPFAACDLLNNRKAGSGIALSERQYMSSLSKYCSWCNYSFESLHSRVYKFQHKKPTRTQKDAGADVSIAVCKSCLDKINSIHEKAAADV